MFARLTAPALVFASVTLACCGRTDDSPAHTANDFRSFSWTWYSGGPFESFSMSKDCRVTTERKGFGTTGEGSGIVAKKDCDAFQSRVVSNETIDAIAGKTTCDLATDDYATFRLELVDGTILERSTSGCSSNVPFSTVQADIRRLMDLYARPVGDAGVDASSD